MLLWETVVVFDGLVANFYKVNHVIIIYSIYSEQLSSMVTGILIETYQALPWMILQLVYYNRAIFKNFPFFRENRHYSNDKHD